MKELPLKKVKELAPHVAYKFVYELMPPEAKSAIEKCFSMGATPEQVAGILADNFAKHFLKLSEGNSIFMLKALEHHHFLWTIENG